MPTPKTRTYVQSPETGRPILLNGPTYLRLASTKKWATKLKNAKRTRRPAKSQARGSSNAGKYPTVKTFCGPAGGAKAGTYPVNSPKRARAALAYARHAPNPKGIKKCVKEIAKKKGWTDAKGTIKMSTSKAKEKDSCKQYKLKDMRALGVARGVKGASRMSKSELCWALGTDLEIL